MSDVAEDFASSLSDLTVNSKPHINILTMLAEENIEFAPVITQTVLNHLQKVPPEIKLPVLYLIDSIVKNVGKAYIDHFTKDIVQHFTDTYEKVDEKTREQMFKVRQTWCDLFSPKTIYALDAKVHQIDPAWPCSAPPSTVHLNPKCFKSDVIASPTSTTSNLESSDKAVGPEALGEQMILKQKKLLELQKKKLELELMETKAKLDKQQKQLKQTSSHKGTSSQLAKIQKKVSQEAQLKLMGKNVKKLVAKNALKLQEIHRATIDMKSQKLSDVGKLSAGPESLVKPAALLELEFKPVKSVAVPAHPTLKILPINPTLAGRERHTIWQGVLEWIEKSKTPTDAQKNTRHVPCQVSAHSIDGEPELKADSWPQKLIMQLMPKQLIGNIGGAYLKNSKSVLFHPQPCEALESLTKVMSSGFAGCVHFTSLQSSPCDIKVLILLYIAEKRAYLGFIPNDQVAYVDRLRKVIQHQKSSQALSRQGQAGAPGQNQSMNAGGAQMGGGMGGQQNQGGMGGPLQASMQQQQQAQMGGLMGRQLGAMGQQQNPFGGQASGVHNQAATAGGAAGLMQAMAGPSSQNNQPPTSQSNQINIQGGMQYNPQTQEVVSARKQNLVKIEQLRQTLEAAQQQEQQYKTQMEVVAAVAPAPPAQNEQAPRLRCSVCLEDGAPTHVVTPCGHLCLCDVCPGRLLNNRCPVCNEPSQGIFRVFMP